MASNLLVILFFFLIAAGASEDPVETVRTALRKTGQASYAYQVSGRHDRAGEFRPADTLTSRIRQYQSVRHGEKMLVKGPEGLWKTADERLGEKTENPDKDAPDIVRTLQEAAPPHRIIEDLLSHVHAVGDPEDRDAEGVPCRRYLLVFDREPLKTSLEKQMAKAIAAGSMERPHEILWATARGSLNVYVDRKGGRLSKAVDERSVKIAYATPDGPDVKTYRVKLEYSLRDWGTATPSIAAEVKERLGVRD